MLILVHRTRNCRLGSVFHSLGFRFQDYQDQSTLAEYVHVHHFYCSLHVLSTELVQQRPSLFRSRSEGKKEKYPCTHTACPYSTGDIEEWKHHNSTCYYIAFQRDLLDLHGRVPSSSRSAHEALG